MINVEIYSIAELAINRSQQLGVIVYCEDTPENAWLLWMSGDCDNSGKFVEYWSECYENVNLPWCVRLSGHFTRHMNIEHPQEVKIPVRLKE